MSDERWLLKPQRERIPSERQQIWRTLHARGYRNEEVWSVTCDAGLRQRLVKSLRSLPSCRRILMPGCGSLTYLQEEILAHCPEVESIVCTDFEEAVEIASSKLSHPKIEFHAVDSTALHDRWPEQFDVVMPVNSVVSDSDEENRRMVRSFSGALRPRGYMLGIFPCIHAVQDLHRFIPAGKQGSVASRESVELNARTHTWFPGDPDLPEALPQVFYSVNDLRVVFEESGFSLSTLTMSIDVLADDSSRRTVEHWYHIQDRRVCLWNFLVTASKA